MIIRQKTRKEVQIGPFEVFGYTKKLNRVPWVPATVTAVEDCSIVSISRRKFSKLMKVVLDLTENSRLIEFLVKSVPGVKQLGQAGKEKILTYFTKLWFKPGDLIIEEGTLCDFAFVIESGECKLVSNKNPLKTGVPIYQGLISQTTSQFNIGVATVGEWLGDDSLIRSLPIEFSVIAYSSVSVLKIKRSDFFDGLSRETQTALKESMESKWRWRRERKKKIVSVISKEIAQINENDTIKLTNTKKTYPIANSFTIRQITKKSQASDSPDSLKFRTSFHDYRPNTSFSMCKGEISHKQTKIFKESKKKVKLYSAGTIGYNLIPFVKSGKSVKLQECHRKTQSSGFDFAQQKPEFSCYGQMVRFGRPASPNPADIWARNNNVSLYK